MKATRDNVNRADVIVLAGEAVDLVYTGKALSLIASKLLVLLVDAAGVDVCEPIRHQITIAALNEHFRLSVAEFIKATRELMTCVVELRRYSRKGRQDYEAAPMLQYVKHQRDDGSVDADSRDPALLEWEFSAVTRVVLSNSNYWAALSRRAVLAIEGRYSLRLYEVITLRAGLDRKEETLSVDQLRQRLGVEVGKLKSWSQLRTRALDPAVREVQQLTGLFVSYEPILKGKVMVAGIVLRWGQASPESRAAAVRELEASRVGRKASREGIAERIVESVPAIEQIRFPADGQFRGTAFEAIARASLPTPQRDYDVVGRSFVTYANHGNIPLAGLRVTETFASFCKKQGPA